MPITIGDSRSSVATDPLRNFKFIVNINHTVQDPSNRSTSTNLATLGFMTVSGLSVENDMIAYRQGGMNAQPLDSMVLTTTGYKQMGDVQVGDQVVDPRGQESKVVGVFPQGTRPVYRVTMRDGTSALGCHQHLWEVEVGRVDQQHLNKTPAKRPGGSNNRGVYVLDTMRVAELVAQGKTVRMPNIEPVEYEAVSPLPIDPYVLGVLIAEGNLHSSGRFTQDPVLGADVLERVKRSLPAGHKVTTVATTPGAHSIVGGGSGHKNEVTTALKELGLLGKRSWEKHIPEPYLRASVEDRHALLQGIMDGDGGIDPRGRVQFSSSSERLRDDVLELVRSLGGHATKRTQTGVMYTAPQQATPKAARDAYLVASMQISMNPFYMRAKADRHSRFNSAYQRRVVSVEYVGEQEVQCIKVSADSHLYITDDFVPTHNTTTQKMPGQTNFPPLSFSRGMIVGQPGEWLWFKEIFAATAGSGGGGLGNDFRCDIAIYVMQHPWTKGTSVPVKARYEVWNAWPQSISWSDLDAGGNGLIMEGMVVQHEGFGIAYAANATDDATAYATE
jgi:phage tail-like protein